MCKTSKRILYLACFTFKCHVLMRDVHAKVSFEPFKSASQLWLGFHVVVVIFACHALDHISIHRYMVVIAQDIFYIAPMSLGREGRGFQYGLDGR